MRKTVAIAVFVCMVVLVALPASAATTAFTYQGKLTDSSGVPLTGSYDMSFRLCDALTGGSQVGSAVLQTGVSVSGGLFTVSLDFGASPFTAGADRWLETTVAGTTLSPRVKIAPVPTALFSAAPWVTSGATISYSGNIGLGVTSPTYPLTFSGAVGDKVSLAGNTTGGMYGFGVQGGLLQVITPGSGTSIGFGYGLSGSFTELMRIKGSGNVGIGTSSPSTKLEVAGTAKMTGFQLGTSATSGQVLTADSTGVGTWQTPTMPSGSVTSAMIVDGAVAAADLASDSASLAKVTGGLAGVSSSKIGIGITSPAKRLDIQTQAATDGIRVIGTGANCPQIQLTNDTASAEMGLASIASQYSTDTVAGDYVVRSASGNKLLLQNGSSTSAIAITSNNIGIGTTTPAAKLDVSGTAKMTGFQLGTSATAGQVLTASATGVGTWQALPSSLPPSGTAGGDLTGTYPSPTIAANAVTSAKIADGTVALADMASDSVNSAKIVDASVAATDLASDSAGLAKVTGGTAVLSGGKIGIGIASPTKRLDIQTQGLADGIRVIGSGTYCPQIQLTNDTASAEFGLTASGGQFSTDAAAGDMVIRSASGNKLLLQNSGGSSAIAVTGNSVGIGTASPAAKLDVAGTAKMAGFQLGTSATAGQVLTASATGVGTWQALPSSLPPSGAAGGDLTGAYPSPTIAANAVTSAKIADASVAAVDLASDSAGLAKVTGGAAAVSGSNVGIGVSAPAIRLAVGDTDTGLNWGGDGILKLSANGTTTATVRPSAVGIASPVPYDPLDVVTHPTVSAGEYEDQSQTTASSTYFPIPSYGTSAGQSFVAGMTGTLTSIKIVIGTTDSSLWTATLSIYDGAGISGTLLASRSILGTTFSERAYTFATPASVSMGQTYTLLVSDVVSTVDVHIRVTPDAYPRGLLYRSGNASGSHDMYFTTYVTVPAGAAENHALLVRDNGNVGIGTMEPKAKLQVAGASALMGDVGVNTTSPSCTLYVTGTLGASNLPSGDYQNVQWNATTGQFYQDSSSLRYKENITPLADDFEKLLSAQPKTYTRPGVPDRWEVGYIAEEIDKLGLKRLVQYDKDGRPDGLNYDKMVLYLVEIAKDQKRQIEEARAEKDSKIADLQKQIDELKALLTRQAGEAR